MAAQTGSKASPYQYPCPPSAKGSKSPYQYPCPPSAKTAKSPYTYPCPPGIKPTGYPKPPVATHSESNPRVQSGACWVPSVGWC